MRDRFEVLEWFVGRSDHYDSTRTCMRYARVALSLSKGQYVVVYNEMRNETAAKARQIPLILSPEGDIQRISGSAVVSS